jgi:hypothetical protein
MAAIDIMGGGEPLLPDRHIALKSEPGIELCVFAGLRAGSLLKLAMQPRF